MIMLEPQKTQAGLNQRLSVWSRQLLGSFPRSYWFIWLGTLVNRLGSFIVPLQMLYLTQERGLPKTQAGFLLTLQGVGMLVSSLIGGVLADRLGRRFTIVLGLSSAALSLLVVWQANSPIFIGIAIFALGMTADLHRPAAHAFVADLISSEAARVHGYGLLNWATNLGMVIAMASAGILAKHSFDILFILNAATALICATLIWFGTKETAIKKNHALHSTEPQPGILTILQYPRLLGSVGTLLIAFVILFQIWVTLPLAVKDAGFSLSDYTLLMAFNSVIIVVVQPLLLGRLKRSPLMLTLAGSYLLLGIGIGLTGLAGSFISFAGTVIVWSLGEIVVGAVGPTLIATMAPQGLRGRCLGLFGVSISGGLMLAPMIGTTIYQANTSLLWFLCAGVGTALAVCQMVLRPAQSSKCQIVVPEKGCF